VLKLIADVGLVGEPNAGKSTLLSVVSAAHPKIADYPFTTLTPNLGVVGLSDARSFVMADIPGLIEGAHEGKGLGDRFLQHIERTRVLAYLIPADAPDPQAVYTTLRREVSEYSAAVADKPFVVVRSKTDLVAEDAPLAPLNAPGAETVIALSAVTGRGVDALKETLWELVRKAQDTEEAAAGAMPP
jgi:GTP-binding protein